MATPLNKAVHRVVELNGEKYLASLEPESGQHPASYALRKMRTSKVMRIPIKELLNKPTIWECLIKPCREESPPETSLVSRPTHARVVKSDPSFTATELKSQLAISPMDYKLKVEVLKALDDLLDVEDLLAGETRTVNP